jgi:hypothetical protein
MATIKIVLDTRRLKADGSCALKLRLYQGDHYRDITLKVSIHSRLIFSEINYDFLEDFQAGFLSKSIKPNTISFYLRTIRTIYNKAMKAKVVDRKGYPFGDFTIRQESTQKRAVGKEVMDSNGAEIGVA